jgi:hypothetical protein
MSALDYLPSEMKRRRRLGDLRKLFRDRYGWHFPDDDAGREDLYELLLPISVGPHGDLKLPDEIKRWAPWMRPKEATELIDRIHRTPIWERKPNAETLGNRLRLTNEERERLQLWSIRPHNMTKRDMTAQRRAKARERARQRRLMQGSGARRAAYLARPSAAKTKPWHLQDPPVSRATYYRQAVRLHRVRTDTSKGEYVIQSQSKPEGR